MDEPAVAGTDGCAEPQKDFAWPAPGAHAPYVWSLGGNWVAHNGRVEPVRTLGADDNPQPLGGDETIVLALRGIAILTERVAVLEAELGRILRLLGDDAAVQVDSSHAAESPEAGARPSNAGAQAAPKEQAL